MVRVHVAETTGAKCEDKRKPFQLIFRRKSLPCCGEKINKRLVLHINCLHTWCGCEGFQGLFQSACTPVCLCGVLDEGGKEGKQCYRLKALQNAILSYFFVPIHIFNVNISQFEI